jgi:hypothetical protein
MQTDSVVPTFYPIQAGRGEGAINNPEPKTEQLIRAAPNGMASPRALKNDRARPIRNNPVHEIDFGVNLSD